jgi:hypothetical protein
MRSPTTGLRTPASSRGPSKGADTARPRFTTTRTTAHAKSTTVVRCAQTPHSAPAERCAGVRSGGGKVRSNQTQTPHSAPPEKCAGADSDGERRQHVPDPNMSAADATVSESSTRRLSYTMAIDSQGAPRRSCMPFTVSARAHNAHARMHELNVTAPSRCPT